MNYDMYIFMSPHILKLLCLLICLSLLSPASCSEQPQNIRFADGPMMRAHHKQANPNADNITVHVIAHSHDDVGWLKTVDQYYYGASQNVQWAAVQFTIDTVVTELTLNPSYKFSIVEMAFLYRWWNNAKEEERDRMRALVKNGQLQFINAGWCMSDQATPYYEDVVDQMTIGLRWLKDTLNYVPDVAWHIDPFGHQASSATMFSQMGFQSFFFSRIDYQDKEKRLNQKSMQMIWRPKLTVPDSSNYIFTHVNYYHYSPPPGYCFDTVCSNTDPIRDDKTMEGYNLDAKSLALANYFKSMALHFRTNNLMHTFGEDFQFANARMWYKNLDKLIDYINANNLGVKLVYSTPSNYVKAIQQQKKIYPTKTDDFFPYSDNQNAFWTGYFTSRVSAKGFVRDFGRWIQAVRKQIAQIKIRGNSEYIKNNANVIESGIWELETSMGILQHHDGVSGTAKQHVANDYIATALRSFVAFTPILRQIQKELITQETGETPSVDSFYFNSFWNQSSKITGVSQKLSQNKTILLALYNPGAAQERQIKINVPDLDLKIVGWNNASVAGDIICSNIYDAANCQLFVTLDFPESGNTYIKLFADSKTPTAKVVKMKQLTIVQAVKQFKLSTAASIKITKASQKFDLTLNGVIQSFFVNYNYYESYQGDGQKSGAYIFRPNQANATSKKYSTISKIHYADGEQVVVVALDGDKTYTRLSFSKVYNYVNTYGFEIQTKVGSIDITDKLGKQITLNLLTTYSNNNTFYTDSNGLEQQTRVLNFRPTWNLQVYQPVAGNYYPVNSHIGIKDINTNKTVTVLTDRSQGGSVLRNGQIELMIHRRLLMDDSRGVGEPLNETESDGKGLIQDVRHYVVFGGGYRFTQKNNDQKVAISIVDTSTTTFARRAPAGVAIAVPSTVKLFLRPFADGTYLLRVHNFDKSTAAVSIPTGWEATQYTLSANQLLSEWQAKRYQWNQEKSQANQEAKEEEIKEQVSFVGHITKWFSGLFSVNENIRKEEPNADVTLEFLKIRTFKIKKSS